MTATWGAGDRAIDAARFAQALRGEAPAYVNDVLPAFNSVTVFYDVTRFEPNARDAYGQLCEWMQDVSETRLLIAATRSGASQRDSVVTIPVRYGGANGPDLTDLAEKAGISKASFIELHSSASYVVLAVGFMPGFGYLGGLPEPLRAPRLSTPRTRVPPGSVGIGGEYTGVYPFESPGGWNLIGRTSMRMFDPRQSEPSLLRVGQTVRFRPLTGKA